MKQIPVYLLFVLIFTLLFYDAREIMGVKSFLVECQKQDEVQKIRMDAIDKIIADCK